MSPALPPSASILPILSPALSIPLLPPLQLSHLPDPSPFTQHQDERLKMQSCPHQAQTQIYPSGKATCAPRVHDSGPCHPSSQDPSLILSSPAMLPSFLLNVHTSPHLPSAGLYMCHSPPFTPLPGPSARLSLSLLQDELMQKTLPGHHCFMPSMIVPSYLSIHVPPCFVQYQVEHSITTENSTRHSRP